MRHIFHGAVDVKLKEDIWVNFLLPCWNASFQKYHMKNSIKSDIFLLNIYSLTNLSSFFFNGKSINQNCFTCLYFFIIDKTQPPFSLVWEPAPGCGAAQKAVWGTGTPRRVREVSSPQALLLILCTKLFLSLGAAAGWPFLPGASACGMAAQRQKGSRGEEYVCFWASPQICRDSPNRPIQPCNTLSFRAYSVQSIKSRAEFVENWALSSAANL